MHEPGYVLHMLEEAYLLADLLSTDDLQRQQLLARSRKTLRGGRTPSVRPR